MPEKESAKKLGSHLLYPENDIDLEANNPWNSSDLRADLQLDILLDKMARGDEEISKVSCLVILSPLQTDRNIKFRQDVVRDSINNREAVRKMRSVLLSTVKKAKEQLFWFSRRNPVFNLRQSLTLLGIYISALKDLRELSMNEKGNFSSEGFLKLFSVFIEVFDEEYTEVVKDTLARLQFSRGVKIGGRVGKRGDLSDLMLLQPEGKRSIGGVIAQVKRRKYTYVLPERDEEGPKELANLTSRAIMSVTSVLGNASENVLNLIRTLSSELAFLEGCINLYEELESIEAHTCFPSAVAEKGSELQFEGLCDIALSLKLGKRAVPNDLPIDNCSLTIITGANRGGKSTFLRSVGQGVLMMQAGMFVGAKEFSSSLYSGVYTHFKREEDRTMKQGKFDEELERMDQIVQHLSPRSLILFNESFAATNAVEGSEIASGIVRALIDSGITVMIVTHLYELAERFISCKSSRTRFLVAERTVDGKRTFLIKPGKPEKTSYGVDLFTTVFGEALDESSYPSSSGGR